MAKALLRNLQGKADGADSLPSSAPLDPAISGTEIGRSMADLLLKNLEKVQGKADEQVAAANPHIGTPGRLASICYCAFAGATLPAIRGTPRLKYPGYFEVDISFSFLYLCC
jgi:hypothetical protein